MKRHSLLKWRLLEMYLKAWGDIISRNFPVAYFVDACAGPGRWRLEGEEGLRDGSPLIAGKIARAAQEKRPGFSWHVVAVERDRRACDRLRSACAAAEVSVRVHCDDFGALCDGLIGEVSAARAASFWLVDPCGLEARLGWVRRIAQELRWREVMFNYMEMGEKRVRGAARAGHSHLASSLTRMFGAPGLEDLISAQERDLLGRFLQEWMEEFTFVRPFAVPYPGRENPIYYLVFGTDNNVGFSIMKYVMQKLKTEGTLFAEGGLDPKGGATRVLVERYGGRTVTWREIHQETDYHHQALYRTLRELMSAGQVAAAPLPPSGQEARVSHRHEFTFKPSAQKVLFKGDETA